MSSLYLLLFRFVVVSISSCFCSGICCFFFFFLFAEIGNFILSFVSAGDFVDTVASVVLAVVVVVLFVGKLLVLFGEFPSSLFWLLGSTSSHLFLLGWSSISLIVGAVVFFCRCRCGGGGRSRSSSRCCCGGFLRAGSGKVSKLLTGPT